MEKLKPILAEIAAGKSLTAEKAKQAFDIILSGEATAGQIGAFLMGLRVRGETIDELVAGATIMRQHALSVDAPENAIDTCGTGGDGAGTYNISTAVAFVVAAGGVPVAKHGNKALSSKSGSAEVLEKLGVKLDLTPAQISQAINQIGMGFMFAPAHHSAMRHVGPVRAELAQRTIFNLLGPLSNPAGAKTQLLGVFDKSWLRPLAETLGKLGSVSAWVVHGSDGLDELTTTGISHIAELKNGTVCEFDITPEEVGLSQATPQQLAGGTPEENAQAMRAIFDGAQNAYRDIVLLNAGAAFVAAAKADTLKAGVNMAAQVIDAGQARDKLDALIAFSQNQEQS
ncbi:MAG: anthranilate phosphoribosyltransferase [Parvibaculales bacterium]